MGQPERPRSVSYASRTGNAQALFDGPGLVAEARELHVLVWLTEGADFLRQLRVRKFLPAQIPRTGTAT